MAVEEDDGGRRHRLQLDEVLAGEEPPLLVDHPVQDLVGQRRRLRPLLVDERQRHRRADHAHPHVGGGRRELERLHGVVPGRLGAGQGSGGPSVELLLEPPDAGGGGNESDGGVAVGRYDVLAVVLAVAVFPPVVPPAAAAAVLPGVRAVHRGGGAVVLVLVAVEAAAGRPEGPSSPFRGSHVLI